MRILKDTEWRDELVTVGYHVVTQIEDSKEVEVSVHGTCDSNGWCDRFITEEGSDKELYHNGDISVYIPELDDLLDHLNDLL
tara:strand:+ start:387 stop:632 length:246 start_codon:yes stop_codon:yes gene_type:complete